MGSHRVSAVARASGRRQLANRQNPRRGWINRVATPKPTLPHLHGFGIHDCQVCANSHSAHSAANANEVAPRPRTAFTMPSRRTSRAAAKRAQQALGAYFRPLQTLFALHCATRTALCAACLPSLPLGCLGSCLSVPQHHAKRTSCSQWPGLCLVRPGAVGSCTRRLSS
jgi:hypothetical protein